MKPTDIKAYMRKQLEWNRDTFVKDLEAMTPEQLSALPGGTARSPLDVAYEVSFFNKRFAKRMRGEELEPFKFDGWMKAPPAFADAKTALKDSMDDVISAWDATPEDELNRVIKLPSGEETSPFDLAFTAIIHSNYHDAQVNYVQSLHGDDKNHWS